ncbi:hypothetical protein DIPPA_23960 [Diplonema papillatum]|nr:hypothetical protein DIPPA_23960 [Diplonema papillatum]
MIIQLLADAGILSGGKNKIVVSVDHTKPLAQAIPNLLSKLKLTKKESFTLYFTTASVSLEHGLCYGDIDYSEATATSSTGGLTTSSDGFSALAKKAGLRCRPTVQALAVARGQQGKDKVAPLPIAVDWNSSPVQLGLKQQGCYLWIKRATKEQEADPDAEALYDEETAQLLDELTKFSLKLPFEYLAAAKSGGTPCAFFAAKDVPVGQVIWREGFQIFESYPAKLVDAVAGSTMLSLNLPYDKDFRTATQNPSFSDEEWSKALSQATLNGLTIGDDLGFAPWLSVFSRCCWPNAMFYLSSDRRSVEIVAIQPIAQGDEVYLPWDCIVDQFWLPADRRQEFVVKKFGHPCSCGRCLRPAEQDKALTATFYNPPPSSDTSQKLAFQVMIEEYTAAIESVDRQQMVTFVLKYDRDFDDVTVPKPSLQLHPHHWRLGSMRARVLSWHRSSVRKRADKHLPTILLEQLEMESSVMPTFWPPRLKHYRQWKDLLLQQSQQVTALLRRMASDRKASITWASLAQLDALERHWNQMKSAETVPVPVIPLPQEDAPRGGG